VVTIGIEDNFKNTMVVERSIMRIKILLPRETARDEIFIILAGRLNADGFQLFQNSFLYSIYF
jgi:hypothetical protein